MIQSNTHVFQKHKLQEVMIYAIILNMVILTEVSEETNDLKMEG